MSTAEDAEVLGLAAATAGADEVGMAALPAGEAFTVREGGRKLGVSLERASALYRRAQRLWREGAEPEASSRVLLLLNADFDSVWTARRRRLEPAEDLAALLRERDFVDLVLSKHFKSAPSWAQRVWLLGRLSALLDAPGLEAARQHELEVCQRVAARYARCYNAWAHRTQLAPQLTPRQRVRELQRMRAWVYGHVSDFSAMWHAEQLLRACRPGPGTDAEVAWHVEFITAVAARTPGHEALWRHLRGLAHLMLQSAPRRDVQEAAAALASRPADAEDAAELVDELAGVQLGPYMDESGEEARRPAAQPLATHLARLVRFALSCAQDTDCSRAAVQQHCALSFAVALSRAYARRARPACAVAPGPGSGVPMALPGPTTKLAARAATRAIWARLAEDALATAAGASEASAGVR